jgi:hypothetical protein
MIPVSHSKHIGGIRTAEVVTLSQIESEIPARGGFLGGFDSFGQCPHTEFPGRCQQRLNPLQMALVRSIDVLDQRNIELQNIGRNLD